MSETQRVGRLVPQNQIRPVTSRQIFLLYVQAACRLVVNCSVGHCLLMLIWKLVFVDSHSLACMTGS